jgi:membrane protein
MSDRPWFSLSFLMAEVERLLGGHADSGRSGWRTWLINAIRIHFAIVRDLAEGQLTLRAMSLVYTTILSLVPLLAISFSVLKGFGYHNKIEPLLLNLLADLGPRGVEITERVVGFVDNIKVGVLGFLGIALLFYTVVSMMQKIERTFNFIWHVARERTLIQRFRDYLSVLVVGPVLVFSSIGITASVMNEAVVREVTAIQPIGAVIEVGARLVPYLLISAAFAFVYVFIPNTRVHTRSALVGGLVAGLLWNLLGWAFASFAASSASYDAIYSTFATLILFMIWLYLGWLIMLIGGAISFYQQHPEYIGTPRGTLRLGARYKEKLALSISRAVAESFYQGAGPLSGDDLVQRLGATSEAVEIVIDALVAQGLLVRTESEVPGYLPGRPPEDTAILDILLAVRSADEMPHADPANLPAVTAIDDILDVLDRTTETALQGRTLKDLAMGEEPDAFPAARVGRIK